MSATDELRRMLDENGVEWWAEDDPEEPAYYYVTKWVANGCEQTYEEMPAIRSRSLKAYCVSPEQAIAATLGTPISADLRTALDFMRIWITDDAHLGESAISYEFEKAEGLRKLDAIEQAIAATLGRGECILHECEGSFSAVNRPVWLCDCGAFVTQYTDATTYHKPRFCPNCGAHVKGGAE